MSNTSKVEIDINGIIKNLEESFSISLSRKPILSISKYDKGLFAAASNDGSTVFLNSLYFSTENGRYYIESSNNDLLTMRLTHELVHVFSDSYGKSGICSNDNNEKYALNNKIGKSYLLDYNDALNEGITQMFTDEVLGKKTNCFADGYYHYKKIAQILKFLFGTDVMMDSYFNHSSSLQKCMNRYCDNLFEVINQKLTYSYYIYHVMKHEDIKEILNADLEIESDICRSLRNELFNECLELIIDDLIIPWIKDKDSEDIKNEINSLLEIFDDNTTVKNRIMFYLMRGYKKSEPFIPTELSKTDIIVSHIIGSNNNVDYMAKSDGSIIDIKTNKVIPYNEQLYEYLYSKIINKSDWEAIDKAFNNPHLDNNTIKITIDGKSISQRRMIMMTIKQYMKKHKIIILNDLNYLDNGSNFEINYVHEKLTMEDINFLNNNYTVVCLPGDALNVLQVIDKKTNRVITSDSLIGKCKVAYKIASLGLSSTQNKEKWAQFMEIAEKQMSNTGMIKKSYEYNDNPFLALFNDGYGCEWFYDYMLRIPVKIDRIKQELYLKENEMNNQELNNNEENERLSLLFSSFAARSKSK